MTTTPSETFYVWRRNDGYINVTNGRLPRGWTSPSGEVTFEQLLVTDDWPTAREAIETARLDAAMREQMTHDPEEGGPRDRSIGEHPRFAEMDARRNARLGRNQS